MDPQQLTIMAHKFQAVLDADVLNERGEQLGFCQRQLLITPFRFGLSVIASMATEQVASVADLHRQFNDLWDFEVSRLQCLYTDSRLLSYDWPDGIMKPRRRCRQAPISDRSRERNFMPTPVLPPRL